MTVEQKKVPPYLAFKTFSNFLDTIKAKIPSRIDRSVMATMSGAVQVQLMAALRYLDFVNSADVPTAHMVQFIESDGEERKKRLREMLSRSYPFLFQNFELSTSTSEHLEDQFKTETAASGDTVRKCVAFFMAAAKAAGVPLSPHLESIRLRGGRQRKKASSPPVPAAGQKPGGGADEAKPKDRSTWSEILLAKFPSFDPNWPDDVKSRWFDAFERLMKAGEKGGQ